MATLDGKPRGFSNSQLPNYQLVVKHHIGQFAGLLHSLQNEFLCKTGQNGILPTLCHQADIIAASFLTFALGSVVGGRQQIQLTVSKWQLHQGDTLAVLVTVLPAQSLADKLRLALREKNLRYPLVEAALEGYIAPVYPISGNPNVWRAIFPTTPLEHPGSLSLTVDVKDGRHNKFHGTVELVKRDCHVESLWFSEAKSSISGTKEELDAIQDFLSTRTSEQYWHGPFLLPTEGEVTTEYGVRRYYNGKFADRKGSVIHAGDMLGRVGDTGLATGPHLHWGLHVHGKAVDPSPWMR